MSSESTEMPKFFEYMKLIGNLKKVKRTGWVNHGVKQPESVAEHMYRMAMITFALPPESTLDKEKCMKIALVHDVGESIVGDLTPHCGVSKADKSNMEEKATQHIASFLPGHRAEEVKQLWKEYEHQSSPEAIFVKDLDKFEMMFQAMEYEKAENRTGDLEEFFDFIKNKHRFNNEIVQTWADDVMRVRHNINSADWEAGLRDATQSIVTVPPKSSGATRLSSLPMSSSSLSESSSLSSSKAEGQESTSAPATKKPKMDAGGDSSL